MNIYMHNVIQLRHNNKPCLEMLRRRYFFRCFHVLWAKEN